MQRKRWATALVGAAAVLTVAACGGGSATSKAAGGGSATSTSTAEATVSTVAGAGASTASTVAGAAGAGAPTTLKSGAVKTSTAKAVSAPTTAAGASTVAAADTPLPAADLSIVGYSTPQEAYQQIISAFRKTTAGKNITFTQSFGASGDQSRAVAAGLPADIVAFSLETDMTRLVDAKIVDPSWNANPYKGMVTDSVVAIGTRKGNPKNLKDWPDLTKPGIDVITPNPFSSGAARWNIMAAYGAASNVTKDDQAGIDYLNALFDNVSVQDTSGRESLQTFLNGKGDALLTYENEAIFARLHGLSLDYTVPDKTLLIENPVAVTATSKHPQQAKAFYDFLFSPTAQRIFADNGYRPVVPNIAKAGEFPTPNGLFTIADLGGWPAVTTKFFDSKNGVVTKIEQRKGVSTSK